MGDSLLLQAFVYLAAAVIAVPIAKRLGLGSVLGYLIAGVLIGPFVLGLVGEEGQDVMQTKVEYGFFGASALAVFAIFVYALAIA